MKGPSTELRGCETHDLNLLLKELSAIQNDLAIRKHTLKNENERLSRLTSQLQLIKQQIDFYRAEAARANELAHSMFVLLTPDLITRLACQRPPSSEVVKLGSQILGALNFEDCSWQAFACELENFSGFKALLSSFNHKALQEDQLTLLVDVWKHCHSLAKSLDSVVEGASVLLMWLAHKVELKLKLEVLASSQRRVPEIGRKVKAQANVVGEQKKQIEGIEAKRSEQLVRITALERALAEQPKSCSTSRSLSPAPDPSHTPQFSSEFPNFESEELYNDEKETSMFTVQMEGPGENVGCCRSRFFCF
jgi:hypothetical protein